MLMENEIRNSHNRHKTCRSVDEASKKVFQFNFESFPFIAIGNFFCPEVLYER